MTRAPAALCPAACVPSPAPPRLPRPSRCRRPLSPPPAPFATPLRRAWPSLGLHFGALAKLAMLLEQPGEAKAAAEQALAVFRVTHAHGPGSRLCEEMARLVWEAQQEAAQARG